MNAKELQKWIEDCAQYIRERREQERVYGKSAEEYNILKMKLDRARKHFDDAMNELHGIERQFLHGHWPGFWETEQYIRKACESVSKAYGPLSDANVVTRREPATRALQEARSAVNLAHATERPGEHNRHTRKIARRIMDAADIEEPSPGTITKWLREIRAEHDVHATRNDK